MKRAHGFTLFEIIIFIVVVSIGMVGILSVMNISVKSSADPMVRKQTLAIAESMLEEIMQNAFVDPDGTNAGETGRSNWDNVADYNAYSSTGIVDVQGTAIPSLAAYSVSPAVAVVPATATDNAAMAAVGALKVTVSVTGPGGTIALVGYRAP